jgi:uncharacterized membrane protein (UPF0182 family)
MCYVISLVAAIFVSVIWSKTRSYQLWWLNLMLWGGAMFGVIDHLWNGEIFVVSSNPVRDLMLGVIITLLIVAFWLVLVIAKGNSFKELPSTQT